MLAPMRLLAPALLVALLTACGGGGEPETVGTTIAQEPPATAVISTAGGDVELSVEVADDNEERARGLMFRTSLAEDAGMVFLYTEPTEGSFWMKNTLIPLSIAFFDAQGSILRILDMAPCREDPCPLYTPGVAFTGALEVNRGAFERLGVREGDRIELRGIDAGPGALTTTSSA
jgi:uncharacterized protein